MINFNCSQNKWLVFNDKIAELGMDLRQIKHKILIMIENIHLQKQICQLIFMII